MAVKAPLLTLLVLNIFIAFTQQNITHGFYTQLETKQVPTSKYEAHTPFSNCLRQVLQENYPLPTKRRAKVKMARKIKLCHSLYDCPKFKICF
jgi:hypothetical protein